MLCILLSTPAAAPPPTRLVSILERLGQRTPRRSVRQAVGVLLGAGREALEGSGERLEGSGEGAGRLLGGSWEGLGRFLEASKRQLRPKTVS